MAEVGHDLLHDCLLDLAQSLLQLIGVPCGKVFTLPGLRDAAQLGLLLLGDAKAHHMDLDTLILEGF